MSSPESVDDPFGLRVDHVFAETDLTVMHGYPMYIDWARDQLDPDFVPYLCALTSALSGKPCLMEEFGGPTEAPGQPSGVWEWTSYGHPRQQFMASEEDFAAYLKQTLPRLVEAGALGAMLWCFADYAPALWDRPPCDESWHERHFGLVRPDGSLKPHADVLRRFAATRPVVQPPQRSLALDISPDDYYLMPWQHARRLYYRQWLEA
jgi:endo-1,4-beta-mannosidase